MSPSPLIEKELERKRHARSWRWISGGMILFGIGIIFDTPLIIALLNGLPAYPAFMNLPYPINSILAGIAALPIVGPICIAYGLWIRQKR